MTFIIGIFLMALLIIPVGLYRGWVLSLLWVWFIVPLGAPEIGVIHAWGLAMAIQFMTQTWVHREDKEPMKSIANLILSPLVILLVGYILKGFV